MPALVGLLLGANVLVVVGIVFVGAILHALCIVLIASHPAQKPSQAVAHTQFPSKHYSDNVINIAKDHRGWFLGDFIADRDSLLRTPGVELKWGIHPKGDARASWDEGITSFSISILINGDFTITFKDTECLLQKKGDFVIWGPGIPHTWRAIEDSVVLTVRWSWKIS